MERHNPDSGNLARFLVFASVVCIASLVSSITCENRKATPPTKGQGVADPNVPHAPAVALSGPARNGKEIFDAVGCLGCHKVYGQGGTIGPDLSNLATQGRSAEWLRTQIRDPKANNLHSQMFPFDYLSDQQVGDLVAYLQTLSSTGTPPGAASVVAPSVSLTPSARQGKEIFDRVGCLGCHKVQGQGGTIGPDLSDIANAGHSREWLRVQIRDPKTHDRQTAMPAFTNLSDQQINDLLDYLETLSTKTTVAPETGHERGRKLFDTLGCRECHAVNGQGGKVGPDLSNEGDRGRSRQWLDVQIRNPRQHDPQTAMPAWDNLPRQQVDDLIDYLQSLHGEETPGGSTDTGKQGST